MDGTTVIKQAPRATFRRLGDGEGAVVLHLDTAEYHGLNEVGALVWELIEQPITFDELIAGLRARLEDAPAELPQDIEEFLEQLAARDLVVIEGGRSGEQAQG